jgi:hypothetical protein
MAIVSDTYKIAYFRVPKVACTSLKLAMHKVLFGVEHATPEDDSIQGVLETKDFKKRDLVNLDGYFKFAVIRDPIDRILSAYNDKILDAECLIAEDRQKRVQLANKLVALTWLDTKTYRSLPLLPDISTVIQHIKLYRAKYRVVWGHTNPTRTYLGGDLSVFDRIYTLDQLDQLKADMEARTGSPFDIPRRNVSKPSTPVRRDDLEKGDLERLTTYLNDDYELLSDYFRRPNSNFLKSERIGA